MRVHFIGKPMKARRLWTRTLWFAWLAGLVAIALVARLESPQVLALSPSPQSASLQAPVTSQAALPATKKDGHTAASATRQKQIYDDSVNLLKLANNLKAEVDKTSVDTLSLAVIRRAEEVEKLAHKMRTK